MNMRQEFHLADQELLMALDGELPPKETSRVESHLATCWACRVRKEAQISQLTESHHVSGMRWLRSFTQRLSWTVVAAGLMLAVATGILFRGLSAVTVPNPQCSRASRHQGWGLGLRVHLCWAVTIVNRVTQ
jgi:anti-sigma factor RsiW